MRRVAVVVAALVLIVVRPGFAHRLDEYLEAATILVSRDSVHVSLRLAPGTKVVPIVLDSIDVDHDGLISDREQRLYADRVLGDLSLAVDGDRLPLRLRSRRFPSLRDIRDGLGEIKLEFDVVVPKAGAERRLVFENRHQRQIGAYLVNGLVPKDPDVRIISQTRNYEQSRYEMSYAQGSPGAYSMTFGALFRWVLLVCGTALLFAQFAAGRWRSILVARKQHRREIARS